MSAVETIEKAIASGVLVEDLLVIPAGATNADIEQEESHLLRPLSKQHRAVLERWNGIHLDILNFLGCGRVHEEVDRLRKRQDWAGELEKGALVFAFDPAGFVYVEMKDGAIWQIDTTEGTAKPLARDLDDFIDRLVFGPDAELFAGDEWKEELVAAGMIAK